MIYQTKKSKQDVISILTFSTYLQLQTEDIILREWIKLKTKKYLYKPKTK